MPYIDLISKSGQIVEVPEENLDKALLAGYRRESPEERKARLLEKEYGGTGGEILAGLAGAARGATFGLSDVALTGTGLVEPETLSGLREANPLATGIGQGVGIGASMLVPGGAIAGAGKLGMAARGASAGVRGVSGLATGVGARAGAQIAGKGLASRALAKGVELGVAGAIEGGAYGAGETLSGIALREIDLGDPKEVGEKVLANVGVGVLLGGAGGFVLGGVGGSVKGLAGRALEKAEVLGPGGMATKLDDVANEQALAATFGVQKKAFDQIENRGLKDAAGKYLRNEIGVGSKQFRTKTIAQKLTNKVEETGKAVGDIVDKLDNATEALPESRLSPFEVADRLEKEAATYEQIATPEHQSAAEYMRKQSEIIRVRLGDGPISFRDAAKQRSLVQDTINFNVDGKPLSNAKKDVSRVWNELIDEKATPVLDKLGMKVDTEKAKMLGSLGETATNAYALARRESHLAQLLEEYATNRVRGNSAIRYFGLTDTIMAAGGVAGGIARSDLSGATATGLFLATANKMLRTYGSGAMSGAASKMSKLASAAKSTDAHIASVVGSFVEGAAKAPRAVTSASVGALIGSPFLMGKRSARSKEEALEMRTEELDKFASNPAEFADVISARLSGLDDVAPEVSAQLAKTSVAAVQFLRSKLPRKPTRSTDIQPHLDDWKPSKAQLSKFERYLAAVMNPLSVLDDLEKGILSNESLEALKTVYPQLYVSIASKMSIALSESTERLPYAKRMRLGLLLGIPTDDTLDPGFISRSQQMYAAPPKQGQGGGGIRLTGLSNLDIAENSKTRWQKVSG